MSGPGLEVFFGNPQSLRTCGQALQEVGEGLTGMCGDLDATVADTVPLSWDGAAATGFQQCWQEQSRTAGQVARSAAGMSATMVTLATELEAALTQFRAAEAEAAAGGCQITPAFVVIPYRSDPGAWATARAIQAQVNAARQQAVAARAAASGQLGGGEMRVIHAGLGDQVLKKVIRRLIEWLARTKRPGKWPSNEPPPRPIVIPPPKTPDIQPAKPKPDPNDPEVQKRLQERAKERLRREVQDRLDSAPKPELDEATKAKIRTNAEELGVDPARFESLARDPAHGYTVSANSIEEARMAVKAEQAGLLNNVVRSPNPEADFLEDGGAGQPWDVKTFRADTFDLESSSAQIRQELVQGNNVMLNTRYMTSGQVDALSFRADTEGWLSRFIFMRSSTP